MKAAFLKHTGPNPIVDVIEVEDPVSSDGRVVIKVEAAGLCHHDVAIMKGALRRGVKENIILGHEISGTVVDIGLEVNGFSIGDRVVSSLTNFCGECNFCIRGMTYRCPRSHGFGHGIDGGFQEFISLDARNLIKIDPLTDLVSASIYGCPIGVSLKALNDVGRINSDNVVVVFGAGGGLGSHAMQIANSLGAEVLSFTTSSEKLEMLQDLNAGEVYLIDEYIDPSELVMALTEDIGANIVFNPVGEALFSSGIKCLSRFGQMLLLGEVTSKHARLSVPELMFRDASIIGCTGSEPTHIQQVDSLVNDSEICPIIYKEIHMTDLLEGFTIIEQNQQIGRVIVRP